MSLLWSQTNVRELFAILTISPTEKLFLPTLSSSTPVAGTYVEPITPYPSTGSPVPVWIAPVFALTNVWDVVLEDVPTSIVIVLSLLTKPLFTVAVQVWVDKSEDIPTLTSKVFVCIASTRNHVSLAGSDGRGYGWVVEPLSKVHVKVNAPSAILI